jgi:hypothetical protein
LAGKSPFQEKLAAEILHYNNCDFPQKLQIKFKTPQNCLHKGLTTYCKRLIREVGFASEKK